MAFAFTPQLAELTAILAFMKHYFEPLLRSLDESTVQVIPLIVARLTSPSGSHSRDKLLHVYRNLQEFHYAVQQFLHRSCGGAAKAAAGLGGTRKSRAWYKT